jgi:hypothetical protein
MGHHHWQSHGDVNEHNPGTVKLTCSHEQKSGCHSLHTSVDRSVLSRNEGTDLAGKE